MLEKEKSLIQTNFDNCQKQLKKKNKKYVPLRSFTFEIEKNRFKNTKCFDAKTEKALKILEQKKEFWTEDVRSLKIQITLTEIEMKEVYKLIKKKR